LKLAFRLEAVVWAVFLFLEVSALFSQGCADVLWQMSGELPVMSGLFLDMPGSEGSIELLFV
jgi:hypothetical protein